MYSGVGWLVVGGVGVGDVGDFLIGELVFVVELGVYYLE